MVYNKAYGQSGSMMDRKKEKDSLQMENEIVFGQRGIKMEIKNY